MSGLRAQMEVAAGDIGQAGGLPAAVGVIGGGRMGAGIAHGALIGGASVVLLESSAQAATAAGERTAVLLEASRKHGDLDEPVESIVERLTVTTQVGDLSGLLLVIEAVPEDFALKADLLAKVERQLPADAVVATNTSSLSVGELSKVLTRPERFVGLHFFNPVPVSALIEVVVAPSTAPEIVAQAERWVDALGKTAVVVRDSPGFASSRLGLLLGLEAIRMVEEGVASVEDIDTAMRLGYKHPIGPLRLGDLVGLDVRLSIAEYLQGQLGDRFAPPELLRAMVARGELGRKSGQGFYAW